MQTRCKKTIHSEHTRAVRAFSIARDRSSHLEWTVCGFASENRDIEHSLVTHPSFFFFFFSLLSLLSLHFNVIRS